MKKVLLLAAFVLGTTVMVSAQTEPAKTTPVKEVKEMKHSKHSKHHVKKVVKTTKEETPTEKK